MKCLTLELNLEILLQEKKKKRDEALQENGMMEQRWDSTNTVCRGLSLERGGTWQSHARWGWTLRVRIPSGFFFLEGKFHD